MFGIPKCWNSNCIGVGGLVFQTFSKKSTIFLIFILNTRLYSRTLGILTPKTLKICKHPAPPCVLSRCLQIIEESGMSRYKQDARSSVLYISKSRTSWTYSTRLDRRILRKIVYVHNSQGLTHSSIALYISIYLFIYIVFIYGLTGSRYVTLKLTFDIRQHILYTITHNV